MKPLSYKEFDRIYRELVMEVYAFWTPEMQKELARHNRGWAEGLIDFRVYLEASSIRFYKAYRLIAAEGNVRTICDIGGFWGVWPLTLKTLGYDATLTESLKYYSGSFNPLFDFIAGKGIEIIDYDPFEPGSSPPRKYDFITVMAVLEHYPHSLKTFMENVTAMMAPEGRIYIEVPNIALWMKRVKFLFGRTPLVPLTDIFLSEIPFIGHHHEFTITELRDLARLSGLRVISEEFYNYSPGLMLNSRMLFFHPLMFLSFLLLRDSRECLAILCREC